MSFSQFWFSVPAVVRKPLVLAIGTVIILAGLALLILPGPGWALIFLGFALLATEFAFAQRIRRWFVALLKKLIAYGKQMIGKIGLFKHKLI